MRRKYTLERNRDGNYHVELHSQRGHAPVLTLTANELEQLVTEAKRLLCGAERRRAEAEQICIEIRPDT